MNEGNAWELRPVPISETGYMARVILRLEEVRKRKITVGEDDYPAGGALRPRILRAVHPSQRHARTSASTPPGCWSDRCSDAEQPRPAVLEEHGVKDEFEAHRFGTSAAHMEVREIRPVLNSF